MEAGEWFRWAGAFFLGALSTVLIEFGRGQLERRQRKLDQRDDIERVNLTEVQENIYMMIRAATAMIVRRESIFESNGEWQMNLKYTDDEPAAFVDAYERTGVLAVRVRDEPIRARVQALREGVDDAISASEPDSGRTTWAAVANVLEDANEGIGDRLRLL